MHTATSCRHRQRHYYRAAIPVRADRVLTHRQEPQVAAQGVGDAQHQFGEGFGAMVKQVTIVVTTTAIALHAASARG